ncbi:hypothetical protein EVAR_11677_1 [Eumeta japonica]|uniref:Uncharacterized protein n=1 Tax=Eumeta variegata TaxID=151549 RepID=A0A4C1U4L7_EUMVA|nr:hypothetical protein EVAR_11677_1 [Eumeta japonica]
MTHCRVPPGPSVRARAWNERSFFHSMGRCVRVEERQRPHTTYTRFGAFGAVSRGCRAADNSRKNSSSQNLVRIKERCDHEGPPPTLIQRGLISDEKTPGLEAMNKSSVPYLRQKTNGA